MRKRTVILIALLAVLTAVHIQAQKTAAEKIAELEKKLQTALGKGKEEVDALNRLSARLYIREPGKCIEYCSRAVEMSEQLDYPRGKARALVYKSYALSGQGERKKALDLSKEALRIFQRLGDRQGIADASNAIGYFYLRLDYYNIALEYFLKTLIIYEDLDRKGNIVDVYWNLGNLYINLRDFQKALDYYQKAVKLLEEMGDENQQARFFHNIGKVYREQEDYIKALEYFHKALKIFETTGRRFWVRATLSNIGETYNRLNKPRKALDSFFKALQMGDDTTDPQTICGRLLAIGASYGQMSDHTRALSYLDRAAKIAQKVNDDTLWLEAFKNYSDLYEAAGDYKRALHYYKLCIEKRDALFNLGKNKQVAEMQEKYETEKKTRQIQILENQNKIEKVTRNALIVIVILAAIIIVLLFKKYLYLFAFWKKQKYIGRYRLTEVIGSGGMGTVHHAHNLRDKSETAAVKVLNDEFFKDESSRKRFKQEGTIIESLDHPNIVKIYERGEYKDKLYIAMEYLQGKTLAQKIREQGKIHLDLCLHMMIQAADALAFIHEKTIIHRDLKPENIMLIQRDGDPDMVKLLDFGLARTRFQSRLTRTGVLVGTVSYMSPEQVTGQPSSAASDIYALGIVFYQMLTGSHAFPGDTITDIADKILKSNPEEPKKSLPDIPDALNRLIMNMLSKEPEQRPSAGEVLKNLRELDGV